MNLDLDQLDHERILLMGSEPQNVSESRTPWRPKWAQTQPTSQSVVNQSSLEQPPAIDRPTAIASILCPDLAPFDKTSLRLFASLKFDLVSFPAWLTDDNAAITIVDESKKESAYFALNPISLFWFSRKINAMRKVNAKDSARVTDEMIRYVESFLVTITEFVSLHWTQEQITNAAMLSPPADLPPVLQFPAGADIVERTADEWNDWILNHERRWGEERDQSQSARDAESSRKSRRKGGKRAMSGVGDSEGE